MLGGGGGGSSSGSSSSSRGNSTAVITVSSVNIITIIISTTTLFMFCVLALFLCSFLLVLIIRKLPLVLKIVIARKPIMTDASISQHVPPSFPRFASFFQGLGGDAVAICI